MAAIRIAVLDDYQGRAGDLADWNSLAPRAAITYFREPIDQDQLVSTLVDFEVLVLMRERTVFPRSILETLPQLKLLVTTGMANASVDIEYLRDRGVLVCGTGIAGGTAPAGGTAGPGAGLPSTVEVAWGLIFATVKRIGVEDRALRAGFWQQALPTNLAGATLGLAGLGRLGSAMVGPAKVFGMDVIAWSEHLTAARCSELGVTQVSKAELLANSDVLSIHLVLSDRTRGLFKEPDLAAMKPTAVLINTSRGPIVQESALLAALRSGQLAAAGLDVFDREPLPADHELRTLANTVLTPHLGYVSEQGFRAMYSQVVEDIAAFLAGSPIRVLT